MIAANGDYLLGATAPARVDEPADAAGVAAALAAADAAGSAVVLFGGGTLQSLGNAPLRYDRAISLRRLDGVLIYDPRDLTIGVEAGISIEGLAQTLAAAGQFIPFDVPAPRRATVGGTLAAGWAGPRRATYGRLRDLIIGSTVALTDGTLATAGGMVVKNVTGYDMSKAYAGSLGTLAAIVRANFKTLPLPAAMRVAIAPLAPELCERTLENLTSLSIEPTAALVIDGFFERVPRLGDEETRLIVVFEGSPAVIDRATRELRSVLGKCGVAQTRLFDGGAAARILQDAIDAYVEPIEDRSITFRSAGLPDSVWSRVTSAAATARDAEAACDFIADIRTGDAIVRITSPSHAKAVARIAEITARLRSMLPGLTILAGNWQLRATIDAWGAVPATIDTLHILKGRFDPRATLAPGRYVGGI